MQNRTEAGHTVVVGDYKLDPLTHRLDGEAGAVQLSPLGSRFLQILAARSGAVVTRETLIGLLWRGDYLVGDPALSRVVSETRRAVGDHPRTPRLIQTVHGQGYRLVSASRQNFPATPPARGRTWIGVWAATLLTVVVLGLLVVTIMIFAVKLSIPR